MNSPQSAQSTQRFYCFFLCALCVLCGEKFSFRSTFDWSDLVAAFDRNFFAFVQYGRRTTVVQVSLRLSPNGAGSSSERMQNPACPHTESSPPFGCGKVV